MNRLQKYALSENSQSIMSLYRTPYIHMPQDVRTCQYQAQRSIPTVDVSDWSKRGIWSVFYLELIIGRREWRCRLIEGRPRIDSDPVDRPAKRWISRRLTDISRKISQEERSRRSTREKRGEGPPSGSSQPLCLSSPARSRVQGYHVEKGRL